jgi:putative ABC transport system substrate-binding protein
MERRKFIKLLSGTAVAWPLAAHAQQARKIVGVLQGQEPTTPPPPTVQVFLRRLRELGWIEGQNLVVEFRGAPTIERMTELANGFVRMNVDVIYAAASSHVEAARRATKSIPIVFCCHGDPVGAGHVASLARPGGNITGLSMLTMELSAKGLDILKETFPNATLIGSLLDGNSTVLTPPTMGFLEEQASRIGLRVHHTLVRSEDDFEGALSSMKQAGIIAFISVISPLLYNKRVRLVDLVLKHRLAALFIAGREVVEAGALMSYGANLDALYRRAAGYVDKILRGANPADMPIEQASNYDLVINLKAAKVLGLTIPSTLLARADEVIE